MSRLDRLLRPKSIAVIGGGAFATNVVAQCLKMGFAGDLWPIHPTKGEIAGVRAFRSVAELPAAPDACFVGVNRHLSIEIVGSLRERNAGGAVCFAAGFKETERYDPDGARLQDELVRAAGDMPIIGPNCYGLINYADGALLWPDQHGGKRLLAGARGAAIITQSSNIACNITMQKRGLPVAFLMTAGNQAQTGLSAMALGLIEDERVSVLGLHIEGFDSVAGFEHLAQRARELKKPIVAMKAGRSEQARSATISHTASLAGSDAASDAFLKRLGIARVDSIPSFIEALKLLHVCGPLSGRRLSSMSCSGGEASVMADSAEGRKIFFPPLTADHKARVQETLGPLVAVANPLDYNTFIWNNEPALISTFTAMASGGFDLNLLVLDFPRNDRCSDEEWWATVRAFDAAQRANGSKGAIVASLAENLPEDHAIDLMARGVAPLNGIVEALDAAEAAAFVGGAWMHAFPSPLRRGSIGAADRGRVAGGVPNRTAPNFDVTPSARFSGTSPSRGEETLDEATAKSLLSAAGLPVPSGRKVLTPTEAIAAAQSLGFPVAVKALGIAHKSEHGAVRLNLKDADEVQAAAQDLLQLGTGLYIERMVAGGVVELIVGITRDPLFGPVMTVGSGGVLVELIKDSATLLLPSTREEIEAALRSLKMSPLLDGYRGRSKADLQAALDTIDGVGRFALENADRLEELDINPLIVCEDGQGAWIADALMVFSSPLEGEVAAKRPEEVVSGGNALAPRPAAPIPPVQSPSAIVHPPLKGEGN
ncbi:MAG TPA: acetate--CoA ligase family protein [Rhizobiaceae bacterium]|nr:acetate--CoA ligase family protein [Rhizobiaceae bacterium]